VTTPTLRPGTPADAGTVLALFDEAVAWLVERGRSDQWGSTPFSEQEQARAMVDRFAASPGFVVAVEPDAGRGDHVVGALVVEAGPPSYVAPVDESERYVHLLITSRAAAGRGIGTQLLDHARGVCERDGVTLLRVDCFGGGERRLVRWYESQGFRCTDLVDVNGWTGQVLEQRVPAPGVRDRAGALVAPARRFDELRTERLVLRRWRADDRDAFAALNADPVVMEHFPAVQDRATSDASVDRFERQLAEHGWGLWAVERRDTGEFIGFTGLNPLTDDMPPAPGVEIGWRLAYPHWGHGFAPEAAAAALGVAFDGLGLGEVVSFTTTANVRSRRVMTKLGLRHDPARDFDHPRTPGWSGQRHVLYAISEKEWRERPGIVGA
jgi:RimJ/RimL family protein N-acetyltransferase